MTLFPVSGVETWLWLPPLAAAPRCSPAAAGRLLLRCKHRWGRAVLGKAGGCSRCLGQLPMLLTTRPPCLHPRLLHLAAEKTMMGF